MKKKVKKLKRKINRSKSGRGKKCKKIIVEEEEVCQRGLNRNTNYGI